MFKTRLISGIILVIIAFITIFAGGPVLLGTLMLVSVIGLSELYKVVTIERTTLGYIGYLSTIVYYMLLYFELPFDRMLFVIALLVAMMAVYVFSFPKYKCEQAVMGFFGVFYVSVMLSFIYQTRVLEDGLFVVALAFLCSWGCDTCAYCVGMLIGKHKMAPKLSPKKSVEGAVGGLAGAALLGAFYALAINKWGGQLHR